jgi:hypothetical protein
MQLVRAPIAADPRSFGRAGTPAPPAPLSPSHLAGDIKLFATTFLAGFVFVSVLLA